MSHTLRVAVVLGACRLVPGLYRRRLMPVALALWSLPLATVAMAAGGLARRVRRIRRDRREERSADAEVVVLGELVALGLAAGMTFVEALRRARSELTTALRVEVETLERTIRKEGSHAVLETATGRGRRLYVLAGRAMITGAPILDAVEMFVEESRAAERARRQAAVRRLPVTLVFPLALLILPGFVIVVLAPALIGSLQRFGS